MTQRFRVGVLVGSPAAQSINRRFARALPAIAPESLELVELEVRDLPLYNRDDEGDVAEPAARFRAQLAELDGLLIVSPEHNRGIPALLANALEWGSRPKSASALMGMKTAITGVTPGRTGTAGMQQHLRPMLAACGCEVMNHPELYVQDMPDSYDDAGALTGTGQELAAAWLQRFALFLGGQDTHLPG